MKNVELPKIPERLNVTEKKLAEMFMERVPTNFLDSGLVYGYNFDYNRENPVWEQPESRVEFGVFSDGELSIDIELNTYKLLSRQLEYDEELDKKFQEWRHQWEGDGWEDYLEELPALDEYDSSPYKYIAEYTYNGDTLLDQQIVFWYLQGSYEPYVIIEVHNGCDARCGFTNPVLFKVGFYDNFDPYANGTVRCPECNNWWDYDCAGRFEGSSTADQNTPAIGLKDYPCEKGEEGKKGIVVVNEKHEAFCPVCGKGKLE